MDTMAKKTREHPLLKYLRLKKPPQSQADFADQIGVSRSFITEVVKDHCRFGADLTMDIVAITGGKVSATDLLSRKITPRLR